jgi:hypothetical protein
MCEPQPEPIVKELNMITVQCKRNDIQITGKLVAEYPLGWSILTTTGLEWIEKQWYVLVTTNTKH